MAVRPAVCLGVVGACLSFAEVAGAQTWEGNRSTPHLAEALVVDATGESGWPFGPEAIDAAFDVRSVYGALGDARAWLRFYLSSGAEPPSELVVYVFVDADTNAGSGGPAVATAVDPALTEDPSDGGYEYLVVTPADGTPPAVWEWDGADWVDAGVTPNRVESEIGTDLDPLLLGTPTHGYVQTMIDLGVAGFDASCSANLFFRATGGGTASENDLEIGEVVECVPGDSNRDRVPDVLVPPDCTRDSDCPGNGVCLDGQCVVPVGCATVADCASDEDCVDGVCVVQGGADCTIDADCDPLVCDGGTCTACSADAQCDGGRCGPDGRCLDGGASPPPPAGGAGPEYGLELEEGDEVRGGACKCQAPGRPGSHGAWLSLLVGATLLLRRRFTKS